jgi:hypothetical protein
MFQIKQDWKTEIKNYILMGFNAEGVKEENSLKQVEIIWYCIEPIIEKLLQQERERLIDEIKQITANGEKWKTKKLFVLLDKLKNEK